MISKKDLKDYEFKTMEDYYDYIVVSRINGNPSQVKDLVKDMSNSQYNGFIRYVIDSSEAVGYYLDIRE